VEIIITVITNKITTTIKGGGGWEKTLKHFKN